VPKVSKSDKPEIKEEVAASIKNFALCARGEGARYYTPVELSEFIQTKAALISAHFILPAGSRVLDMGCGTGEVTYALAQLNPRWGIIGFDRDPAAIEFARKTYRLPNLTFRVSDVTALEIDEGSVDGIINSNILHCVYSESGYSTDDVAAVLESHMRKLRVGGTMLVRDYMLPSDNPLILLELPNLPSRGDKPEDMSDADLLVRFSQTARPMVGGHEGFFIEEQMPRREGTRLFRLPHKWALEFIHRKNLRKDWDDGLKLEYTFFSHADFRREFARMGMRMVFSAPYANPWVVKNKFKGRFQLYSEDYAPLSMPATNHFIVAQKVSDKQSLALEERRPSQKPVGDLQIMTVRDKKSGIVHELVKRPGEYCDVVPYRITPDNRLIIYVRSGYPRPIVNAVSRGAHNLDGKKWSGHLIEPITMDTVQMTDDVETNRQMIFDYVRGYASLRPKGDEKWYVGETYFPSPDRIDEAIEPVFIEVENPQKTSWPISEDKEVAFSEAGTITELDGADILLASQVGLLPEPRLELHVFELMSRYGLEVPRWIGEQMPILPGEPIQTKDPEDILSELESADFEDPKKGPVTLRQVKAVFVEEGKGGRGGGRGISAQDVEFVVTEDGVENIAILLPLSQDLNGNLLIALEPKVLPVPNRISGDGAMLNAPSIVLPKDVKTIDDAKAFIADKFRLPVDQVGSLGESYFTHTGVTPQRVYPFMLSSVPKAGKGPKWQYMRMKQLYRMINRGFFRRVSADGIKAFARVQMMMSRNGQLPFQHDEGLEKKKSLSLSTEKIALEKKHAGYSAIPSRILGQRGGAGGAAPKVEEQAPEAEAAAPVARVAQRLMQSYAEAKKAIKDAKVDVTETPDVVKVEKDIEAVAAEVKKTKPAVETESPMSKKGRY
jgi:SAM-dependent methyltransferase